ncbi:hypothetical protein JCM3770_006793 [Rhodotorula araucariae]
MVGVPFATTRMLRDALGTSKCKGPKPCNGTNIPKGTLRCGTLVTIQGNTSFAWRHWGCTTSKQFENMRESFESAEELDGYEDLEPEDQERVKKAFEAGHVADEDIPDSARKPEAEPELDEDGNPIETPKKAKAKRAPRKKKAAASDEAEDDDEEFDDKPKKKTAAKKKAPAKKGGKKKKDESDNEEEAISSGAEEEEEKPKKKRAAPKRKAKAESDDEEEPKPKKRATKAKKAVSDDEEEIPKSKKRGPPKDRTTKAKKADSGEEETE